MARAHRAHHPIRTAAASLLAVLIVAPALPLPTAAADPSDAPESPVPSIAYVQAMEHASDDIEFEPGGRVTVAFSPRADDHWPVDGRAPGPLPAGRATGEQMADSPQGAVWAPTDPGPAATAAPGTPSDPGKPEASAVPVPRPTAGSTSGTQTPVASLVPAGPPTDPAAEDAPVDAPAGDTSIDAVGAAWTTPGTATGHASPEPAAAGGLRRQVFGFLPYWELSGASRKLNYDVISTIAYFSVGADRKGNLRKRDADGSSTTGWGGWTSSSMTSVINAAHQHGTRVVLTLSVFAWTSGQADIQRSLLGSSAARLNLAKQAAAAVRDRGADGINLDFEPLASGYADEFVALLKTVRSELNKVRSGYQLTYDTTGYIGNYPLEASVATGAADAIFIMGYDYRTGGAKTAGSIDPLSGPGYDLTDTVRSYLSRVKPSKVILGIPWYGRAWSTVSDAPRSENRSGLKYGYSSAVNYESLTDLVAKYGRRWDSIERSPYIAYRRQNCTSTYGCVTSWRQLYYDDGASTKLRLALVNDYGLRGAGMWALGYDGGHPELYRAISESFLVDKSAPQAGIRILASSQPDEGFIVSWAARDVSAIASYDVQVSRDGGAWTAWLAATKATSEVYPGRDGHGYAFRVRARDSKGNTGSWNVTQTWSASPDLEPGGFGRVTRDDLSYRTGPDTAAAKLGTLPEGTIVAVTRGPVSSDGYAWYEVTQPIKEWSPVSFVERGVWIAARSDTTSFVSPYRAPNATRVDAGIVGLDFGQSGSAVGSSPSAIRTRTFSPNGDDSKDGLRLRWTNAMAMESMTLKVYRTDGSVVGSTSVPALASGSRAWTWDGKVGGTRVRDGRYVLQLSGQDAGRTYRAPSARPVTAAQRNAYGILIDTVAPALASASASGSLLSPNGDDRLETVALKLRATGATRWTLSIVGAGGTRVRSASGSGGTAAFTWNGASDAGSRVPDGRYSATMAAWDAAGNRVARTFAITVDTRAPTITQTVAPAAFSPNGDGAADTTALRWSGSEKSTGTARLYKGSTIVRSWTMSGRTSWSTAWTGRTSSGTAVADGAYAFTVAVRDAAGNRRTVSKKVVVDRTGGLLRWSGSFFPQDRDGLKATASLSWRLTRTATTTLRLYDARGSLVRTVWSGRSQASGSRGWTWDGRLADGTLAPQGRYTARLTVKSSLSTQVLARDAWAAAFAVKLSAATVKPGQTLTITFSTVERLAARPSVAFTQPGRGAVTVAATKLSDGRYRASFKVASGSAGPATLKISAKDIGGRTNTMTVPVAIGR